MKKSVLSIVVLLGFIVAARAQTTHYPQYDANGMPIKTKSAQAHKQASTSIEKGPVTIIGKGGMPKNAASYEQEGNKTVIYRRKNSILQPKRKIIRKENGSLDMWYYDDLGTLKPMQTKRVIDVEKHTY